MKRYFQFALCLLLAAMLAACGDENHDNKADQSYTGNYLSWTGSDDPAHYLTLVRVDGSTGAVTNIGGYGFFSALKYAPDGTLYGISTGLYVIDPSDGATTLVGEFRDAGNLIFMSGAAFSPDGTLYVIEGGYQRVFRVDLASGDLTHVGTPAALPIWDLEFAPDGTLYGAFADLFVLNPANMSTISTIGSTGPPYIGPLTFGPVFGSGNALFGMDINPSTHIYSLSLDNGAATPLVATGSTALSSLVAERTSNVTASAVTAKKRAAPASFNPQSQEVLEATERALRTARER